MIRVEAVLVKAVMPDSILVSIVGIGRGVGVVGGGTYGDDDYAVDGDVNGDDKDNDDGNGDDEDNDDNDGSGTYDGLEPMVMMVKCRCS